MPTPAASFAIDGVPQEVTVEVEAPRPESVAPASEESAPGSSVGIAGSEIAMAARSREETGPSSTEARVAMAEAPASTPLWSFDPTDPARRTPSDLGIGSPRRTLFAEGVARAQGGAPDADAGETTRERARAIDRSMREMLTARDVALGLGHAGPLVSATHEAASSPGAPEIGATILEVDSDSAGTVIAARAEDHAWDGVASAVVRRMAGKAIRVPRGSRGLRARLHVVAEKALPSGSGGGSSLGAVPDDVPGGATACDGKGLNRRCVAGMPLGVTNAQHDTANVGAKPSRIVHVRSLGEAEL
jgi:hypothetical protein